MNELLSHPEIVNPYKTNRELQKDNAFIVDLGLDDLLSFIPFNESNKKESRAFAKKVLSNINTDSKTVVYRQEVFDDLVVNKHIREKIIKHIKKINELAYTLNRFDNKSSLTNGLDLLRKFREFINDAIEPREAKARAVKEVVSYFSKIKGSESFEGLCEFLNKIETSSEISFRVTIGRNGSPLRMYAVALTPKEPERKPGILSVIERLFLKKNRYEQSMESGGRVNNIGKIIQRYMDEQFLPLIKEYAKQIREVIKLLQPLDFYAGFALYFALLKEIKFDICKPVMLPAEKRKTTIKKGRNPLLLKKGILGLQNASSMLRALNDSDKIVPNDIHHQADENMFVITGPNNGGKTTYVKTAGLVQLMSQQGLYTFAESAEVSFVDAIFTHFVTPDDITKGEGRYRNELRRMKEIFEKASPYSFVILDEPCGGTSYEEGLRQSLALLDGFHKLGAATYFTTHMHPLTKEVDKGRYQAAKNISVECILEGSNMTYTYKIKNGASQKSYGLEIAKELGLMPENIEKTVFQKAEEKGYDNVLRKK